MALPDRATGGFEWDPELVRSFLRGPMRLPAGVPTNTGDGLRMAMRVGAMLGMMREAGLENCSYHNLSGGIVALHRGYHY